MQTLEGESVVTSVRGALVPLYSVNHALRFMYTLQLVKWLSTNLVDPASSHMLVSKIKPCMSQYKLLYGETANGSLKQL